ncbi:bifunctional phosphoribosyl-AMP cyclohydrolase/phosphoribosyl-ATP diphosphatase HisIE [Chitinophaga sancti]|uniref:Histidine biosynthesis bifunctional protein HisIE n=1 Tax=Chitinophaga sancti TaxID=1004 RepID=A0A1K1PX97_9BACT|nr:bifunctional phosphoribosyl-AMP cyclohydrolase/phosphoribosyl-ATP diphosphatase HisIE [Chitinophaga sancti]WQD61537.1 bifunctional phosphoribosyl-AMP cyclohydrolase/phosphoribosyl-ATP diphosphatase HisIE [Chitinophaga sancti]WQG92906.1 bifunctional phosphoribosyl-AMP cyclohydrolase/phosphoribosyl-ATP diphosphatase HisIE [Chitinophaga sancti]SFW52108.1 phosphoribosyl-ATP pyrophosphatase /phosphoribosyl-AMP cyclohydrolase [Chitinophaga sancti]
MYNYKQIDFQKSADGLVPAIIQDAATHKVLMLGYMNQESLDKTLQEGKVTFFSRSKQRLWTKGEQSGNFLTLVDLRVDCDNDTLLIKVNPVGVVCHTGADTCWDEKNISNDFLSKLENVITDRKNNPSDSSYTSKLFAKGINKIAQKVGEEAVEVVIEAKDDSEELFLNESADLLFHYLVLLSAKGYQLSDVLGVLQQRHK